jgi:hypothetical protein
MQGQQRGAQERRREGGTREREKGRRKSLGLLVGSRSLSLGDRRMRRMEACYGGTDVMERSCAMARGGSINNNTGIGTGTGLYLCTTVFISITIVPFYYKVVRLWSSTGWSCSNATIYYTVL